MNNMTAVILSPDAVKRQLCGVVLSRLMNRGVLTLEAAALVCMQKCLAKKISSVLKQADFSFSENQDETAMICIFSGENAIEKVSDLLKNISFSFGSGIAAAPVDAAELAGLMNVIAGLDGQNNLLTPAPADGEERTLLIIKPENFRQPSVRPGAIIDILMQLDLKWVGCKVHSMSIDEALEFYGPVRQALRKKLAPKIGCKAVAALEKEFNVQFTGTAAEQLAEIAGNAYADDQFEQIVEFMAGKRPAEVAEQDRSKPAGSKCMILIFDGVDAVAKIRRVLGPTNPAEAAGGTIRYDFGTDIMVNAAHASDSPESYQRESKIVKVNGNDLFKIAAEYQ